MTATTAASGPFQGAMPLTAVLVALVLPAPASAAWAPAEPVARNPAIQSGLTHAGDGTALAWWRGQRRWRLAHRPATGGWSAACAPVGRRELVAPVTYGRSRIALGALRGGRLSFATGSVRGCRPPLRGVASSSHRIVHPALAASRRGHLALVWWEDRGTRNDRVLVALRRPGGRFGRPRRLGEGAVRHATAAVGPAGDVLVAWEARGEVRARFKPAGRGRFGPARAIRSMPTFGARVQAVVGAGGAAYVGWTAQRRSEGGDVGAAFVQAAYRPAGAREFRRAQMLERFDGRVIEDGGLRLALDSGGTLIAAWTGRDGVRTAASVGGRFTSASTLAGGDARLADLAVAPGGAAVVLWDAELDDSAPLEAAYRPAGGSFGPQEAVATPGRHGRASFPPASTQPTALWWQPDGLRAARRAG